MAVSIERKGQGIYQSPNFEIASEGKRIRRKVWVVKPRTSAARQIELSATNTSLAEAKEWVQCYERRLTIWVIANRPYVHRWQLATLRMVAGEGRKPTTVIDQDIRKQWVGIGWIDEGPATEQDYAQYPTVID